MPETQELTINMGPQHPSTHGVLRLVLNLDGEIITKITPDIGYLHRGIEKLAEDMTYAQFLPVTDRLDYLAAVSNNLAYCLAVEKLLGLEVPKRASYVRVILTELSRIASHLVWIGTHALDIGAYTPFLYAFREREDILDIYELFCGSRLTTTCFRIGGLPQDIPEGFVEKVEKFTKIFPKKVDEYEALLTKNEIWLRRTQFVGIISAEDGINYSLSGPSLRGSGVKWDIRKAEPYCVYDELEFDIPTGRGIGDVYDRYLVRMEEMRQSCKIVQQAIAKIPDGDFIATAAKFVPPPKERVLTDIEALIHHFKLVVEGFKPPAKEVYACIEAPKGELGFYIVSDGSNKPYRLKIRTPSFANLQSIYKMIEGGMMVADAVAIIGSLDIVLGEIDR
ncbi:MAG: NADH dehydrogenase (quinone) subunit D [bacterium]|nr:NADH dehydrogenase (quinone) subunit D [bacterium]